jgi:hypothetical protein
MSNKLTKILDIEVIRQMIANCPQDEVVIVCPHYSINIASEYEDCEELQWDLNELENDLDCVFEVNDYDDLIIDVHGIIEY